MNASGLNSGFMLVQYTAASLVCECKTLAHPASVDSIPSSAGQEDHVSMGMTAARHAREIVGNAETVRRARGPRRRAGARPAVARSSPARGTARRARCVRERVAFYEADREFSRDIAAGIDLVRSGALCAAAEARGRDR